MEDEKMLQIILPATKEDELWDEKNKTFIYVPPQKEQVLQLEHSLIALSKWESKWCKPFLENDLTGKKSNKTEEEIIDYVRCMTINKNIDPSVYYRLKPDDIKQIKEYIYAPMTATTIRENGNKGQHSRQGVTSELIYYWMIANNIPFECEKWHLSRLIMLIKVCTAHGEKTKKTPQKELISKYADLNERNRRKFNSKG